MSLDEKYNILEPELSKWEREESQNEKSFDNLKEHSGRVSNNSEVTSDIIKRAENAIFTKAVNAIRPQESTKHASDAKNENLSSVVKKIETDKKYENVQVTVPYDSNSGTRSVEVKADDKSPAKNKASVQRVSSIKDRLGKRISRSRSRDPDTRRTESIFGNNKKSYQLNSCISSMTNSYTDKKKTFRNSRTPENKSSRYKKYQRSKSKSLNNRGKELKILDKEQKVETKGLKDASDHERSVEKRHRERNRSSSPSSRKKYKNNDYGKKRSRSRSRSRSSHSKKKRKKEKKTKKRKSKDRK